MTKPPEKSVRYRGPERRHAFFPRRLRSVPPEALLVGADGDRRSGHGRRRSDAPLVRGEP